MFTVVSRFPHLSSVLLASTDYSAFTYRSHQAAAKYAVEQAGLLAGLGRLGTVRQLELSQPAITPDLLLLRLFYTDPVIAFPPLAPHDLLSRPAAESTHSLSHRLQVIKTCQLFWLIIVVTSCGLCGMEKE